MIGFGFLMAAALIHVLLTNARLYRLEADVFDLEGEVERLLEVTGTDAEEQSETSADD